ncbi:Alpha-L-rhamnosidase [Penicillium odoratum]|uniref:Alpha-L-rhamnosidase n=1 Tax=Penicillium odoratum TaxID=1167516 RepID=UPI0025473BB8|nr:Alpha-L-rhamnosidase [Penicillium odoratum]KAJ5771634.1 Alpha-L-rhamnosidase [Penicillium odoratum]
MIKLLYLLVFYFGALATAWSIESGSLRTQGLQSPISINVIKPRLSWRLTSQKRNDSQIAYQIQAASTASSFHSLLWDTGKIYSSNISALYAGKKLESRSLVYWRVRAWNSQEQMSSWSEPSMFEIGLLHSSDWSAQWITNDLFELGTNSLPIFVREFQVECQTTKARLYALGLGMQSISLNGEPVTDEVLAPGYSNFNKTLLYTTYDITQALKKGSNFIRVELGRGEWDTQSALGGRYMKYTAAAKPLILLAQLEYTCSNGTIKVVASDDTWVTSVSGPTLESAWYGGEEYDARMEISDASASYGNSSDWVTANITTGPSGNLTGPLYPALKIVDTINAVSVSGPYAGQYVIDFGTNFAGWYSLVINETAGTRVTMWPAERLLADGAIDQSTTGRPIYDAFTSAGVSQVYSPKFMYHGFRYLGVNLTSAPRSSDAVGLVIRTDSESVGDISTSDSMLNSIHRIINRAIQSNLYSVMTDCPHREKLGWLEQTHLVFEPVNMNYDIQAFGRGVVQTLVDSQTTDGLIPDIAPEFVVFEGGYRDDPNWGNAIVLLPLMLYQMYGDLDLLEELYDAMQKYVDFLSAKTSTGILDYGLGDWVAFDTTTPLGITATFGYVQALQGIQEISKALGKNTDATTYAETIANVLKAFQSTFATTINGTYAYGSGSQASNAMALDLGVVPTEYVATVTQQIVEAIKNNGSHLSVGEIALPSLFRVLQAQGESDIIYDMVTVPSSPSYAYQVLHGATSLTERWDGPTASCSGCNSLNHFMLGYADQWLSQLSGLSQAEDSIAWNAIDFSPIFISNMTSASSIYRSIRGLVSATWSLSSTALHYNLTVPIGATGNVTLDTHQLGFTRLKESGVALTSRSHGNGILSVNMNNTTITVKVGSGKYFFVAN